MNAKTILVPVDFSDATPRVCDVAKSVAAAFGGKLILLHVEQPAPEYVSFEAGAPLVPMHVPTSSAAWRERLEELQQPLLRAGLDVSVVHGFGDAVSETLREARAHAADLIVIGSHGHGALYNLLVGSVTSGVLKEARCPVLVVPAREVRSETA